MKTDEEVKAIRYEWLANSKKVKTPGGLRALMEEMIAYDHDYDTIVYAVAASALAAARTMDRSPRGGITGFQASCVMWTFVSEWLGLQGEPLSLIQFRNMLYPQYEEDFTERSITPETWKYLQEKAAESLRDFEGHPDVRAHWQSIVNGTVPFGYWVKE